MAKISLYIDDGAWKRFRGQVFARHGTLRGLSEEVERLICSEDIEMAVSAVAGKLGIPIERGLTASAIKRARPKLRGAVAERILGQMRDEHHAGHLPRH